MQATRTSKPLFHIVLPLFGLLALLLIGVSGINCIDRYLDVKKVEAQQKAQTMAGEWRILTIDTNRIVLASLTDERKRILLLTKDVDSFPPTAIAGDRITITVPPPAPERQSRAPESYLQFKLR